MKLLTSNIIYLIYLIALVSCINKDLCYDHDLHAPSTRVVVEVDYDLENPSLALVDYSYPDLITREPDGLRMQVYSEEGSVLQTTNLATYGGTVSIPEGMHSLLFYNNDTEYIVFDNLASFVEARATTRSRTRSSYLGNSYKSSSRSENTVNPPDMLFGAYIKEYRSSASSIPDTIRVTMQPLVFNYVVIYEFSHGFNNVALARGALAGMADAVSLSSGTTSSDEATILYDCTLEENQAVAVVKSFGIPDYPKVAYSKSERVYALNLEVRLSNGNYVTYDFDVSDQVAAQPQGGVITVSDIQIDDADAAPTGGGFVPSINGWGDDQVIPVPLN